MNEADYESPCSGCSHPVGQHVKSVDGKVRCFNVQTGVSTDGVLGMPWSERCDCVDYRSKSREWKEVENARIEKQLRETFERENACLISNMLEKAKSLKGESRVR